MLMINSPAWSPRMLGGSGSAFTSAQLTCTCNSQCQARTELMPMCAAGLTRRQNLHATFLESQDHITQSGPALPGRDNFS